MLAVVVIFVVLLSVIMLYNYKTRFVFVLPLFNIIIDALSGFFEAGGTLAFLRASVLYGYLLFYIKRNGSSVFKVNRYIVVYALYVMILIPFSSNIEYSFRVSLQVLISILFFPIAYNELKSFKDFNIFYKSIIATMFIMVLNVIISELYSYGDYAYSEEQLMRSGNIYGQSWNTATYCLLLIPLIISGKQHTIKNILIGFIGVVLLGMLLLNLSRIPIITLILGYLIYYYKIKNKNKVVIVGFSIIYLAFLSWPFWGDLIVEQMYIRKEFILFSNITNEARFLETKIVLSEIFSLSDPIKTLFGTEVFNSPGNYGGGGFGNRQIHIDFNNILHGSGVVGLVLYILIFIRIYKNYKINMLVNCTRHSYNIIGAMAIVFIVLPFIFSLSGQMYNISFRTINFIYLGMSLKLLSVGKIKRYYEV